VCGHEFSAALNAISKGNWCPYCATTGGKLCGDAECGHCHKKSFASHPKSEYWSAKNEDLPRQCAISKNSKRLFDCADCGKEFSAKLSNISHNDRWCPFCINKTEAILFEFLKSIHPDTIHQFKKDWCRSQNFNRYLPFDFCIPELKIIIELDGGQHFFKVKHFKSDPDKVRANDLYKEQCASSAGYHVIRLLQEDVWRDKYDWKKILQETIATISPTTTPHQIIRLCQNDEYDSHATFHTTSLTT
jgi:very-short-patch-repair endonuclease